MHLNNIFRIKGKNLFDIKTAYSDTSKFTITDNTVRGTATSFNQNPITISSELIGKTLTFSAMIRCVQGTTSTTENARVVALTGGVRYEGAKINGDTFQQSLVTFTVATAEDTIRVTFGAQGSGIIEVKDMQLELGSTATEYEPYIGELKTMSSIWERAIPAQSVKAQLTSFRNTRKVKNLAPNSGEMTTAISATRSAPIKLKAGDYYVKAFNADGSSTGIISGSTFAFRLRDTNNQEITRGQGHITVTAEQAAQITNYVCFWSPDYYTGTSDAWVLMLSEGSTAQPYYPYFSPQTVLPSLKAFGNHSKHKAEKLWGRYVPAVASDTAKWPTVLEGMGKITLDGTESWTIHATIAGLALHSDPLFKVQASVPYIVLCGRYESVFTITAGSLTSGQCCGQALNASATSGRFAIRDSAFTDVSTLKAKLAANPLTIYYPLANPTGNEPRWVFVKDIGLSGTGTDFGYFNEESGEFIEASGASGSLIQPISYVDLNDKYVTIGHTTNVGSIYKQEIEFMISELDTEKFTAICGADNGLFLGVTTGGKFAPHNLSSSIIDIPVSTGAWHKVIDTIDTSTTTDNNITGTFDGVEYSTKRTSFNASPWAIGGLLSISYGHKVKIRKYKVWKDDELIYDFSSAKVGSASGFIDYLTGTVYNTTDFQYGSDIPYAQLCPDIIKVNTGDVKYGQYGKNLFDKSLYDGHGWYYSGGVIANAVNANATIVMRAIPNKTYYFKHCSVKGGMRAMYTTEENWGVGSSCEWLVGSPTTQTANVVLSFTVPSDAKWIFLLVGRNETGVTATFQEQLNDYMLSEEVLTADTPYEPYHFGIHTDGSHKLYLGSQGAVDLGTLNWAKHATHGIWNVASVAKADGITNLLITGTNYSLTNVPAIANMVDKTYKGHASHQTFYIRDNDAYDSMTVAEFKAALSGKYLFYQRTTDATFIPPEVRDIPMLLSEDSFADTQNASKTEAWALKVLDGTETWNLSSSRVVFTLGNVTTTNTTGICSHFESITYRDAPTTDGFGYIFNNQLFIAKHEYDGNVDGFKSWLASEYAKGTPVIILYPLATPSTESITTTPVSLITKAENAVTSVAELSVKVQATYRGKD